MWSKVLLADDGAGFSCSDCQYMSKNKRAVFEHVESKHVQGSGHYCPVCDHLCRSLNALRSHVVRKHGSSSFTKLSVILNQCMRNWTLVKYFLFLLNKYILEVDELLRTKYIKRRDLKDWKCLECGYTTSYQTNMKNHIEAHHLNIGTRYECQYCHAKLKTKNSYQAHKSRCRDRPQVQDLILPTFVWVVLCYTVLIHFINVKLYSDFQNKWLYFRLATVNDSTRSVWCFSMLRVFIFIPSSYKYT